MDALPLSMRHFLATLSLLALFLTGCGGYAPQAKDSASAPQAAGAPMAVMDMAEGSDESYAYGGDDAGDFAMEAPPPPPAYAQAEPPAPPPAPAPPTPSTPSPAKPDVPPATKKAEGIKPLLIYMATYHMAVFETQKAIDAVQAMARELDGYLVRRDDTSIVVRVPSESYRGALEKVGKLGDVLHREETVEDVTEQFMDLMTRLKNARAVRDRVQQLLLQTKDVKEALEVERELARITADIEVMEGKLKRLRELVAFSTITIRFQALATEQVRSNVTLPFPWLDRLGLQNLLSL